MESGAVEGDLPPDETPALILRWWNPEATAVRVPDDPLAIAVTLVDHQPPGAPDRGYGIGHGRRDEPAAALAWATVPAGETIERRIPLPARLPAGHALPRITGRWAVEVIQDALVTGVAPDQRVPAVYASLRMDARGQTVSAAPGAVTASVVLVNGAWTVRLNNHADEPVWVPPLDRAAQVCAWSVGQHRVERTTIPMGDPAWIDETNGVMLPARASIDRAPACAPLRRASEIAVTIDTSTPWWPGSSTPLTVVTGPLQAAWRRAR
jgi:hypothetical protein